jgi:DinB superfamily
MADDRFTGDDFRGAVFRDCDMRGVKITDSWLVDVNISGLIGNLTVNDVDVTAFVEAELEVLAVRADRQAVVRRIVGGLTDEELARVCTRSPAPGYPEEPRPVGHCLRVVMTEECGHQRYAVRDLAVLETRA